MERSTRHKGDGHRKRLREKFLESGLTGFHDYEVLELLLTLTTPRRDCKPAAKEAMSRFKSLQGVFEATSEELQKIDGIGPVNTLTINIIQAVADRYLERRLEKKDSISNSKELEDFLSFTMRDNSREHFRVIFLDAKNMVIKTEILSSGTLTSTSVYPREVVKAALENNAAALIFAHNHPSGDPSPSKEDISITKQLLYACRVMGITVHEHIIVSDGGNYSFADNGYMAQFNLEYEKQGC